jgi:hypothetical protein
MNCVRTKQVILLYLSQITREVSRQLGLGGTAEAESMELAMMSVINMFLGAEIIEDNCVVLAQILESVLERQLTFDGDSDTASNGRDDEDECYDEQPDDGSEGSEDLSTEHRSADNITGIKAVTSPKSSPPTSKSPSRSPTKAQLQRNREYDIEIEFDDSDDDQAGINSHVDHVSDVDGGPNLTAVRNAVPVPGIPSYEQVIGTDFSSDDSNDFTDSNDEYGIDSSAEGHSARDEPIIAQVASAVTEEDYKLENSAPRTVHDLTVEDMVFDDSSSSSSSDSSDARNFYSTPPVSDVGNTLHEHSHDKQDKQTRWAVEGRAPTGLEQYSGDFDKIKDKGWKDSAKPAVPAGAVPVEDRLLGTDDAPITVDDLPDVVSDSLDDEMPTDSGDDEFEVVEELTTRSDANNAFDDTRESFMAHRRAHYKGEHLRQNRGSSIDSTEFDSGEMEAINALTGPDGEMDFATDEVDFNTMRNSSIGRRRTPTDQYRSDLLSRFWGLIGGNKNISTKVDNWINSQEDNNFAGLQNYLLSDPAEYDENALMSDDFIVDDDDGDSLGNVYTDWLNSIRQNGYIDSTSIRGRSVSPTNAQLQRPKSASIYGREHSFNHPIQRETADQAGSLVEGISRQTSSDSGYEVDVEAEDSNESVGFTDLRNINSDTDTADKYINERNTTTDRQRAYIDDNDLLGEDEDDEEDSYLNLGIDPRDYPVSAAVPVRDSEGVLRLTGNTALNEMMTKAYDAHVKSYPASAGNSQISRDPSRKNETEYTMTQRVRWGAEPDLNDSDSGCNLDSNHLLNNGGRDDFDETVNDVEDDSLNALTDIVNKISEANIFNAKMTEGLDTDLVNQDDFDDSSINEEDEMALPGEADGFTMDDLYGDDSSDENAAIEWVASPIRYQPLPSAGPLPTSSSSTVGQNSGALLKSSVAQPVQDDKILKAPRVRVVKPKSIKTKVKKSPEVDETTESVKRKENFDGIKTKKKTKKLALTSDTTSEKLPVEAAPILKPNKKATASENGRVVWLGSDKSMSSMSSLSLSSTPYSFNVGVNAEQLGPVLKRLQHSAASSSVNRSLLLNAPSISAEPVKGSTATEAKQSGRIRSKSNCKTQQESQVCSPTASSLRKSLPASLSGLCLSENVLNVLREAAHGRRTDRGLHPDTDVSELTKSKKKVKKSSKPK